MAWKSMFTELINLPWKERDMSMAHLPLMGSPVPLLILTTCYLLFTLKIGPAYMSHRPAFKLKKILLLYNLFQVLVNFYIFFAVIYYLLPHGLHDFGCIMPFSQGHELYYKEIYFTYAYLMLKVIDFMDTIFFVLRKNMRQVTFLHVYHHVIMVLAPYTVFRYVHSGGHSVLLGILNSLVHGFMYLYYLVSAWKPHATLWWKKYITILQLTQFLILAGHNLWPLLMRPDCQYPRVVLGLVLSQNIFMLVLFSKFFIKSYVQKEKQVDAGNVYDEKQSGNTHKLHAT